MTSTINILFDDEMEVPINHKTDRPVSKAVKRAQQRSLMEEELIEFKMSQCTQHTVPKSTETFIIMVVRRACQKSSTRTVSATPTPEAPAKTKDHSNNHNCGEDEDHSAKAAPTATDSVKVTDKPSERDSNKDSVDNDDETTNLDMPIKAQSDSQSERAKCRSASTPVASKSETVTLTPAPPKAVSTPAATSKAVSLPATVKAATHASTKAAEPAATANPIVAEDVTTPARGRGTRAPTDSQEKTESEASPPREEALPECDPAKMIHEYVPKTMEKGGGEYNDNSEPDGVTTAKTDSTEPATGAAAKKEEPSPHEENVAEEEKLKAEVVDGNNGNEDEDVGDSLKHI